jgi:hypothetical protein
LSLALLAFSLALGYCLIAIEKSLGSSNSPACSRNVRRTRSRNPNQKKNFRARISSCTISSHRPVRDLGSAGDHFFL